MEANPLQNGSKNQGTTPSETPVNPNGNSGLSVEVKMLREQIDGLTAERDRERRQLVDQIDDLRSRLDGAEAERVRLNAILTDQREQFTEQPKRGLWARLVG